MDGLREQVEKQQKIISRLRGEASQLAYRQQQLDSEQQKNKHEISVTAVKVTSIGSTTVNLSDAWGWGFSGVMVRGSGALGPA